MVSINELELLKVAQESGIISMDSIREQVLMKRKEEIIDNHNHKIWQSQNGEWNTYLDDESERGYSRKHKKTKEELIDLIVDYYREIEENPTFKQAYERWMEQRLEYEEISLQSYTRYSNEYKRFFSGQDIENVKIKEINEGQLRAFIKTSIKKYNLTAKAYAGMRTIIRGTFLYAKENGFTNFEVSRFFDELNLPRTIFKKKAIIKEQEVFNEDEIEQITTYLRKSSSIVDQGLLLIFQTGLRIGELVALEKTDLAYLSDNKLMVTKTEIQYRDPETNKCIREVRDFPKTDAGYRIIIIPDNTVRLLRKILIMGNTEKYLFENKHGQRMKTGTFQKHLRDACEKLDIPLRSPHKIRKTYGTTLIDGDVDDSVVAEQMGHEDISTTKKYYYYSNKNYQHKKMQIDKAFGGIAL